jgi:hypothetical protein
MATAVQSNVRSTTAEAGSRVHAPAPAAQAPGSVPLSEQGSGEAPRTSKPSGSRTPARRSTAAPRGMQSARMMRAAVISGLPHRINADLMLTRISLP